MGPEKSSEVSLEKGLRVKRESRVPRWDKIETKKNELEGIEAVVEDESPPEERRWRSEVRRSTTSR